MSEAQESKPSIEAVPDFNIERKEFPYETAEYLGLLPGSDHTPNFERITNHLKSSLNLHALKDTILSSNEKETPALVSKEAQKGMEDEGLEGLDEEEGSDEGNEEDWGTLDQEEIEEEEGGEKDTPPVDMSKALEGLPQDIQEELQRIPDEEGRQKRLKTYWDLIKKDPEKTREFKKILRNLQDTNHPAHPSYLTLANALGVVDKEGPSTAPPVTFVKELAGSLSKEGINEAPLEKLEEGMNRSINLLRRHKVMAKLQDTSEEDLLDEFSDFLSTPSNLRKTLSDYRRAGNFRNVMEDEAPIKKKRTSSSYYVKVGVPSMGPKGESSTEHEKLRKDLKDFYTRNLSDPTLNEKLRVMVVSAPWIHNAEIAMSGARKGEVGVVLNLAGKKYFDTSSLAKLKEEGDKGPLPKEASSSDLDLAKVDQIFRNHSILKLRQGPSSKDLALALTKWLVYCLIQNEINTAVYKINPNTAQIILALTDPEKEALDAWISTSAPILAENVQDPSGQLSKSTNLAELKKEIKGSIVPVAEDFSEVVYDYFLENMKKAQFMGSDRILDKAKDSLYASLPNIARGMRGALPPKDLKELMEVIQTQDSPEVSDNDISAFIKNNLKDLLNTGSFSKRGSAWTFVSENYHKDEKNSLFVQSVIRPLSNLLYRRDNQTKLTFERLLDLTSDLFEKVIDPSVKNGASTQGTTSMVHKTLLDILGAKPIKTVPVSTIPQEIPEGWQEPLHAMVYLHSEFPHSGEIKTRTLNPGQVYDLKVGMYSADAEGRPGRRKPPEGHSLSDGYVLQIDDGQRVIMEEEALLSSNEIPRFFEYATKTFIDQKVEPSMVDMTSTDDEEVTNYLENLDEGILQDLRDVQVHPESDPVMGNVVTRALRKMPRKGMVSFLKKYNRSLEGHLAESLKEHFGTKVERAADGSLVNTGLRSERVFDEATGEFQEKLVPSVAQRVLVGDPTLDHSARVQKTVAKELSSDLADLSSIRVTPNTDSSTILEAVGLTKEVSEKFLEGVLKNSDLPFSDNIAGKAYQGFFEEALLDVAHSRDDLSEVLKTVLKDDIRSHRFTGGDLVKALAKRITAANQNRGKDPNYVEAWQKAAEKNPSLFGPGGLFKPSGGWRVTTGSGADKLKSEEYDSIFTAVLERYPSLAEKVDSGLLSRVLQKEISDQGERWVPRRGEGKNEKVSLTDKRMLLDKLIETEPSLVEYIKGLPELSTKPKALTDAGASGLFQLRDEADPEKLKEFLKSESDRGQLAPYLISGYYQGFSIRKILEGDKKKEEVKKKEEKSIADITSSRNDKRWRAFLSKTLDKLFDAYKERIASSDRTLELLADGRDILKGVQATRDQSRSSRGLANLSKSIVKVLDAAEGSLWEKERKRRQDLRAEGKDLDPKQKAQDIQKRHKEKLKYLKNWLGDLSFKDQGIVLDFLRAGLGLEGPANSTAKDAIKNALSDPNSYVNSLYSRGLGGGRSIPAAMKTENHNVLIELAQTSSPARPIWTAKEKRRFSS